MSKCEREALEITFGGSSKDCVAHSLHRCLNLAILHESKLAPLELPEPGTRLPSSFRATLGRNLRRNL